MARRKKPREHPNHERWLVSYADFITLLFAFFVVMFASSQSDKAKAQQVSDAMTKAFDGKKVQALVAAVFGGAIDDRGKGNAMMRGPGGAHESSGRKERAKNGGAVAVAPGTLAGTQD